MRALNIKTKNDLKKITQTQLDKYTEEIINFLFPSDLIEHTRTVYNRTIGHFNSDPHITEGVVDELIVFMKRLNENELVCDLGCGNGRDTLFMTTGSSKLRNKLMQRASQGKRTTDKFSVPRKRLKVIALDLSEEMLKAASKIIARYANTIDLAHFPVIVRGDMHSLSSSRSGIFDGVWSCTSLFVHTPKQSATSSLKTLTKLLKYKGKFCLSYIQEQKPGKYNKLLLSSTGNIKYFSQPNPDFIRTITEKLGLKEIYFRATDFEVKGKLIQKEFFANHIFEKIK